MKQMKRRTISWLLMFTMVVSLIMPGTVVKAEESDAFDGYVYLTIEKSTVGQGLILEPVKVGYHNGESVNQLLVDCYGADNFIGNGYITGIKDGGEPENWTSEKIPGVLFEYLDESEMLDGRTSSTPDFLCANDYVQYLSGWTYSVNDVLPDVGMGDYLLSEESDGDVIRIQFTLTSGDVVGMDYSDWGYKVFWKDLPSKLALIRKIAEYPVKDNSKDYTAALDTLSDWDATSEEVNDAETKVTIPDVSSLSDYYSVRLVGVQDYIFKSNSTPAWGSEWVVLNAARYNLEADEWYATYLNSVKEKLQANQSALLDKNKSTENSRTIIGLSAIGANVTDIAGYDLTAPLADFDYVKKQGLNGSVYALIALDCKKSEIPAVAEGGNQTTREKLIEAILASKLENGGWTFFGTTPDPDMTGMAIQSLAPYYNSNEDVKAAVDQALDVLSNMQQMDGGYASWGTVNAESCAQVVCALADLGIDADSDPRFVKYGNSVLDAMLGFYDLSTSGFKHTATTAVNAMASQQVGYALIAYDRFAKNKNTLYDMTDVICLYNKDHLWDEGKVTKEPTVEAEGEKTYTCIRCGEAKTEKIDKLEKTQHTEHTWDAGKVTKEPTVEAEGEKTYTCTECGETKTEKIDKLTNTQSSTSNDKKEDEKKEDEKKEDDKKPSTGTTQATTENVVANKPAVNQNVPVIKKVASSKKKQVKVTWKKVTGVTGYQIQISTSSKFKKSKTKTVKVKGSSKTSVTKKSLKSKKKYYVRIRTYKTVKSNKKNKTTYGAWSKKQSVKVK